MGGDGKEDKNSENFVEICMNFNELERDLGKSLNFVAQNRSLGGGRNSWKSGGKFPKKWSWGAPTISDGRVMELSISPFNQPKTYSRN